MPTGGDVNDFAFFLSFFVPGNNPVPTYRVYCAYHEPLPWASLLTYAHELKLTPAVQQIGSTSEELSSDGDHEYVVLVPFVEAYIEISIKGQRVLSVSQKTAFTTCLK